MVSHGFRSAFPVPLTWPRNALLKVALATSRISSVHQTTTTTLLPSFSTPMMMPSATYSLPVVKRNFTSPPSWFSSLLFIALALLLTALLFPPGSSSPSFLPGPLMGVLLEQCLALCLILMRVSVPSLELPPSLVAP